jgi:hypothetical protein
LIIPECFDLVARGYLAARGSGSVQRIRPVYLKEVTVVLLWVLVALLLLFAIVGGVAVSKFLFFVLIVAGILALFGVFTRTA